MKKIECTDTFYQKTHVITLLQHIANQEKLKPTVGKEKKWSPKFRWRIILRLPGYYFRLGKNDCHNELFDSGWMTNLCPKSQPSDICMWVNHIHAAKKGLITHEKKFHPWGPRKIWKQSSKSSALFHLNSLLNLHIAWSKHLDNCRFSWWKSCITRKRSPKDDAYN